MTQLLVATTNQHKMREIRDLLAGAPVEVIGLDALPPIEEPEETAETFEENARLKALYYDGRAEAFSGSGSPKGLPYTLGLPDTLGLADTPRLLETPGAPDTLGRPDTIALPHGRLTVAEDSGLVVDALDGEPGVRSARFLRSDATYPERFAEIFRRLDERPDRPRTARFVCALAVVSQGRLVFETRGTVEGEIAREARGSAGFGYDPIFFYPPYGTTLAEVTQAAKLRVAHRGQAFRALAEWLRNRT